MTKKNVLIAVLVAILVIAIAGSYYFPVQEPSQEFGGGTRFVNGLSTISTSPVAGQVLTDTLSISSTTASTNYDFILGTANSTTTIFAGKLCLVAQTSQPGGTEGGKYLYYTLSTSTTPASGIGGWATSTIPCY